MILGRFRESAGGCLVGHIRTAFFKSDKVVFEPTSPSPNPKAPAFRVYTGDEIELGAAWRRTGADDVISYDETLDDPTFAKPVWCALRRAREGDGYVMYWDRRPAKKTDAIATIKEGTRASDVLRVRSTRIDRD